MLHSLIKRNVLRRIVLFLCANFSGITCYISTYVCIYTLHIYKYFPKVCLYYPTSPLSIFHLLQYIVSDGSLIETVHHQSQNINSKQYRLRVSKYKFDF